MSNADFIVPVEIDGTTHQVRKITVSVENYLSLKKLMIFVSFFFFFFIGLSRCSNDLPIHPGFWPTNNITVLYI